MNGCVVQTLLRLFSSTPSSYKRKILKRSLKTTGSSTNPGQRISGGNVLSFDLCSVVKGHRYEMTHNSPQAYQKIPLRSIGRAIRPISNNDVRHVMAAAASLRKTKSIVPFVSEKSIRRTSLSERLLFFKMRKGSRFLDTIRINCTGGMGGSGIVTFGIPGRSGYGRPDGGNGGSGGNVYLRTDPNLSSYYGINRHIIAGNGENGGSNMCSGKNGSDCIVRVPSGTLITVLKFSDVNRPQSSNAEDVEAKEQATELGDSDIIRVASKGIAFLSSTVKRKAIETEARKLCIIAQVDMPQPNMLVRVATGGRGGLGNKDLGKFPPNEAEKGLLGSSVYLQLDLKIIADVGLVGLPNAGKSSILASLTRARPKISQVPFSTLHPNLGVLVPEKDNFIDNPVLIADLPGLVEGAHLNIGLGHAFLKHVYRSKVIAYVVDVSAKDPFRDFEILRSELNAYDPSLLDRPSIIIVNKTDLSSSASKNLPKFMEKITTHPDKRVRNWQVVPFSAKKAIMGDAQLKLPILHSLSSKISEYRPLLSDK